MSLTVSAPLCAPPTPGFDCSIPATCFAGNHITTSPILPHHFTKSAQVGKAAASFSPLECAVFGTACVMHDQAYKRCLPDLACCLSCLRDHARLPFSLDKLTMPLLLACADHASLCTHRDISGERQAAELEGIQLNEMGNCVCVLGGVLTGVVRKLHTIKEEGKSK